MGFTNEEFQIMVDELLYQEPVSFEMLCCLAERTLKSRVDKWCKADGRLQNRDCQGDILQEIYIRLIHTTVDYYLLRDGLDGPVNDDPAGFERWMYIVGKNVLRDYANRLYRSERKTVPYDDMLLADWAVEDTAQTDAQQMLRQAVDIVLQADAGIYKILTWLAQALIIAQYDITKIDSNHKLVELFEHKTLGQMYEIILYAAGRIPWLQLTQAQQQRIAAALERPWDENLKYGEVEYGAFFMKKGGNKSISDWVNRMNTMVRRAMDDGTSVNG